MQLIRRFFDGLGLGPAVLLPDVSGSHAVKRLQRLLKRVHFVLQRCSCCLQVGDNLIELLQFNSLQWSTSSGEHR